MNFITESLIVAAREGNLKEVQRLVLHEGQNVNVVSTKYKITPLHAAALHGHTDTVRFLLKHGALLELTDDWGCTPLHNASGAGHYNIVDLLCAAGANIDARASNKGKTPIEIARDKGKYNIVNLLQEYIRSRSRNKLPQKPASPNKTRKSKPQSQPDEQHGKMPPIDLHSRYGPNSSAIVKNEKFQLMRQLRRVERQEAVQDLQKEGRKIAELMSNAAAKYQSDMDMLKAQMNDLKMKMGAIENQRQKDMQAYENRLKLIGKRVQELETQEVASPENPVK